LATVFAWFLQLFNQPPNLVKIEPVLMPVLMPRGCENKKNQDKHSDKIVQPTESTISRGETAMTSKIFNFSVNASRIDAQHIRIALAVGTLILFVLGAGAPASSGNG
jgi:hypothetical protein